jgi:hypothetical protein
MAAALRTARNKLGVAASAAAAVDTRFVSQGFVNGLTLYAVSPVVFAALKGKRVDPSVWRTGAAAGTFIGGYRLFRQLLEGICDAEERKERGEGAGDSGKSSGARNRLKSQVLLAFVRRYRHAIAGAVSAALGLAVDDAFLGSFLVSWWTLRAVRCVLPTNEYGSTAVMCAAAAVVNPAAFLFRGELQPAYSKFMERMALGVNRSTLLHGPGPAHIAKKSLHGWDRWTYCDELHRDFGAHPTGSCSHAVGTFVFPRVFWIAFKLYAPLYLAWNVFWLRFPNMRYVENTLRSSLFLSLYTITQYVSVMWYTSTISPTISRNQHAALAWTAGLWTLLERKERRSELATYCAAHAINAIWLRGRNAGHFMERKDRLKVSYPLLVIASAVLTHFHDQHGSGVRKVFGFDGPSQPF